MFSKYAIIALAIILTAVLSVEEIRIHLLNADLVTKQNSYNLSIRDNAILFGNIVSLKSALQVQNDKFIALQAEMAADKKARDAGALLAVQNRKSKTTIGGDDAASMNVFMKELFE